MKIQIDLPESDIRFLRREGVDDIPRWTQRLVESEIAIMKCFPSPAPREIRADLAGLPEGAGWDLTFSPPKSVSMLALDEEAPPGEKRPETGRYSGHPARKKRARSGTDNVVRVDFRQRR